MSQQTIDGVLVATLVAVDDIPVGTPPPTHSVSTPDGQVLQNCLYGPEEGEVAETNAALRGEAAYRPLVEQLGREVMANTEAGEPNILPGHKIAIIRA